MLAVKPISLITIVAGPQFSFLLKDRNTFNNGAATVEQQKLFETDNIRRNLLSFTGGADINLSNFVIGLRANYDTQNNNGDGTTSTPRYKNAWYQATVGIRF